MTEDDRVPGAEKGAVKNPRQEAQEAQRCGVSYPQWLRVTCFSSWPQRSLKNKPKTAWEVLSLGFELEHAG